MEEGKKERIEYYDAIKISPEEMVEFLIGNNISPKCPMCGGDNSLIHADKDDKSISQLMWQFTEINAGVATSIPSIHFLVAMVVCEQCGYIRNFAAGIVNKWLNLRHPDRIKTNE